MRLTIASPGRFGNGPERALFELYRGRIRWNVQLREVEARGRRSPAETVRRESELLSACCPAGAYVVALDAAGRSLSSADFARRLGALRDRGSSEIVFLIGGADGLAPSLVAGADLVLAFGAATWPHLLVRTMLVEQIFRAQEILAGHPYHRARETV
ncbi:MAG: 23S rRNA (pseudouridine(1915)-N(3))-methyltransferase RlmH [Defluviicoccus sp.]|nr:23S rRNA (pseudouridine(1915)-N(3))-methyltransferase RlmH [Defluviicoccus sp.]MDE0383598.1 23S rRNA (pseudouridine(1915)-N(3))-methyltransferase RlmH [Defluviicoccus sp.]